MEEMLFVSIKRINLFVVNLKNQHIKHITYREESAIQSLIRGPNALLSTKRRHLLDKYCYGPLKA